MTFLRIRRCDWFRRFLRSVLFHLIYDLALIIDYICSQREPLPRAGIVDSQSVKAPGAMERGYDANKKINGRKRHIAVDTDGRLLVVNLTTDDVADSTGVRLVLDALVKPWPWVKHLFGDAAYDRQKLMERAEFLNFTVEIVPGLKKQVGFEEQPRRWVVELTIAWRMRYRRSARDYERRINVSGGMIYLAMDSTPLRRLLP